MTDDVKRVHGLTTPEDEASTAEVIRLHGLGRANTIARWENLWRMWLEGKTFEEMGRWIGRHPTTAKQLLKRAFKYKLKTGMPWPTDQKGRKVCDIPHPAPKHSNYDQTWVHIRTKRGRKYDRCMVCGSEWFQGKTLVEVFADEWRKNNANRGTGKPID